MNPNPNPKSAVAALVARAASNPAKAKRKVGRPPRAAADKQAHSITVRLTPSEHAIATANASLTNLSVGEIARRGLLARSVVSISPAFRGDIAALSKLGNLLAKTLSMVPTQKVTITEVMAIVTDLRAVLLTQLAESQNES